MDPVINPYTPGAGSRPPELTGRDKQIADFTTLVKRLQIGKPQKNLMVTGLRGVGKTVLLNRFADIAESQGFRTAQLEITHEMDFKLNIIRLLRKVILSISPIDRMKKYGMDALGILKAFSIKNEAGLEFNIDVDAIAGMADSGDFEADLADLFIVAAQAAREHGTGIVFLIDEIQFLEKKSLEALISALHQVNQKNLPLAVVGAGLPHVPGLSGDAKSYAERLFQYPMIGKLDRHEAKLALKLPAHKESVLFHEDALQAVIDFTDGYPYFLQEYGQHVWNIAKDSEITIEDVKQAKREVIATLDESFFRVRIGRCTNAEIRYMSGMGSLGQGPYSSKAIAEKLGREMASVSPIRSRLIHKGLVYGPDYGLTDFTVPQYDYYMRRNHPFEALNSSETIG